MEQQQQEFPMTQTTVGNLIINQPVSTGVPLGNVNLVVSDSNGQLISSCPVTLISSPQKSMQVAEVSHNDLMHLHSPVNHLVAIDQQNQILAAMQNEQQQQQMLQSLQQTQNLLQQSQQLQATTAALQGFQPGGVSSSLILTPTIMSNVQPTATLQTVNLTDGTVAHIQTQPATAAGLQGIQPGESSSLILTPTIMSQVQPTATLQTINLTDGTVTNIPQSDMNQILMTQPSQVSSDGGIQTITLNQDQLGLATSSVQIPISTTILPSTITIDPNLFKKSNNNMNPLTAQNIQIQQSPTPVFNNQSFGGTSSVIVDSNLINALTSNNLQSVNNQLLSDMIVANQQQGGVITMPIAQPMQEVTTSQQIQMVPISLPLNQQTKQTVKKLSNQQQQQQQPARNFSVATGSVAPPRTTIKTIKIPGVSPVKRKQTIQSIQNFSPNSAIFKDLKKTGHSTVSSTSSSTPTNVTIKKKIIKKSNVIPVKPTSVEQVQPGVFKLQLKKVSSAEATALLSKQTISSKSGKVEHSLTSLINTTTGSPLTDLKNIGRSAMQLTSIKGGGVAETSLNGDGNGTKAFYGGVNHQTLIKTPTHVVSKSPQQVVIKETKKVVTPVSINGGKLARGGGVTTVKVSNLPKNVVNKIQDLGKYNVVKIASSPSAVAATTTISTKNNIAISSSTIATTPKETLKQVTIVNSNGAAMSPIVVASKVTVVKSQSTSYTNHKTHQDQSSQSTQLRSLQPQSVSTTSSTTVDDTLPTTTTPNSPTQSIVLPTPPRVKFPTLSPAFLRATLEAKKAAATASTKPITTTPSKMSPVVVVAGKERTKIVSRLSTKTVMPIVETSKNKQNQLSPPITQSGAPLLNSSLSPPSAAPRIVVTNNNNNNKMKAVTAAGRLKPKVVISKATSSIPGNVSTTTTITTNTTRSTTTSAPAHRQKSPITSSAPGNTATTNKTKNSTSTTRLSSPTSSSKEQENSLECQERGFVVSPVGCLEEDITTLSSEVDIDATLKALPKIPLKSASSSSSMGQANALLQKAKQTCSLSSSVSPRSQRGHHHLRSPEGSSSSARELDEVEIIREAIESSRVGQPAEINMRELAKLEITKQLRRCKAASSTTTTNATAAVSTATGIKRKTTANSNSMARKKSTATTTTTAISASSDDSIIDAIKSDISTDDRNSTSISAEEVLTPADLKRKLSDSLYSRKDTNKATQQSDVSAVVAVASVEKKAKIAEDITSPPPAKKDSTQQQRSRNKASGRRKKKTSSSLILDESRKRERPKKFDDFVLATENKQQQAPPLKKEKKTKKFFFPKEQEIEKKQDSTKNQETGNAKNSKDTNINKTVNNDSSSGSSLKTEGTTTDSEMGNTFSDNKTKSDLSISVSSYTNTSTVLADDEDDDDDVVDIDNKMATSSASSESATSSKTTTTATSTITEKPLQDNKNSKTNSQNATPSATTASSSSCVNTNKTNSSIKMKTSSTATSTSASKKKQTQSKTKNTKTNANSKNKNNKRRKKKQPAVSVELEELPEHLKKAKAASASVAARKMEDTVIDVTKVKLRSSFTETSFVLNDDSVEPRTFKLINRKNWVCTLCGRPGNLGTLDVLFGPYKIAVGGGPPSTTATTTTDTATKNDNNNKENTPRMNVWLHRDCAVWTSNICLANQTLRGLGESLNEAALTVSVFVKYFFEINCFYHCKSNPL